jgi:hypothetical protein
MKHKSFGAKTTSFLLISVRVTAPTPAPTIELGTSFTNMPLHI